MKSIHYQLSITFFLLLGAITSVHAQLLDLEANPQEFILETRQIIIPEYPHAFNPSLVRWQGSLLLSFRILPDPKRKYESLLGVLWLDEQFHPIGVPQFLDLNAGSTSVPPRADDGRLVVVGSHLYLVYSDNRDPVISKGGYRVYLTELRHDGTKFYAHQIEGLFDFEGNNPNRREKNWVPFDYQGQLLLAYSLAPHMILHPIRGTHCCETVVTTCNNAAWDWGDVRGGTPGLLDGNEYLAFFHSSQRMASLQSHGKEVLHYVMGAYTFSKEFPFAITRMSKDPIIGKSFYTGVEYPHYWFPIRAVYPCGFIFDGDSIIVSYGRQDHEMWVTRLDKKGLYASLVPVSIQYPS